MPRTPLLASTVALFCGPGWRPPVFLPLAIYFLRVDALVRGFQDSIASQRTRILRRQHMETARYSGWMLHHPYLLRRPGPGWVAGRSTTIRALRGRNATGVQRLRN